MKVRVIDQARERCPESAHGRHCDCNKSVRDGRCCFCANFYDNDSLMKWVGDNNYIIQIMNKAKREYEVRPFGPAGAPPPPPAYGEPVMVNFDNIDWGRAVAGSWRLEDLGLAKPKKKTPQVVDIEGFDDDGSEENVD